MRVYIGSDHGGFRTKGILKDFLRGLGHELIDIGCDDENSVDYPDYAKILCESVGPEYAQTGAVGILVCGTGIGMSMCANKMQGIRAALCVNEFEAEMTRKHNDANVLCLGGRVVGEELAKNIAKTFVDNSFDGERHERRVGKMMDLEK